ncbi:glycosyltransferase family 2 protein [Thiorhodovibrio litoralis]|uniref:glycosyltransferase family 2 protein n=1 Tax=Thiorhodovibrio litoralis TaxID=2952932 RepID=UPI002B257ADE|nr:glycosyltransferase family 2 protein [Thiorhodovibrio litoralis]WPL11529.1 PGL/p-HBAD biosynthesis glycosyltransferase [Thiorhodovibrio litoralis]
MRNTRTPLVSIITSTLNSAALLSVTLGALADDVGRFAEHIIIDGNSSDNTRDIVQRAGERVRFFISEPDQGIYDAWNKGVRAARGTYLAFVGAGDFYVNNGLSLLVDSAMKNQEAEFISSKMAIVRDGSILREFGQHWNWNEFRRNMKTAHAGSLHKRVLFDRYGLFDPSYRIAGDYEFLLRAGPRLATAYVDAVTVHMAADGVSHHSLRLYQEVERAKLQHRTVSAWLARVDRRVAEAKRIIRRVAGLP